MRKNQYQAFASSFLDLWQEQIARAMSDTDFLQALMQNMQEMQAGMFNYDTNDTQRHSHPHAADPAHASQSEPDELADVQRRLAAAERKIVKLEAQLERVQQMAKPAARAEAKPDRAAAKRVARPSPEKPTRKPAKRPTKNSGKAVKTSSKASAKKRAVKRN